MYRIAPRVVVLVGVAGLLLGSPAVAQSTPRVEQTDDDLIVRIDDVELLRYHKTPVPAPAGMDPIYTRSGYIHPVRTPDGVIVTGDFAPDHAHQHALFGAWVKTKFAGHAVDFWNLHGRTGRVVHQRVDSVTNDDTGAHFTVEHVYQDLTDPDHPVAVLIETWTLHAIAPAGPFHAFDIAIKQHCASDKPLQLPQYHYGGMALRGNNQWFSETAIRYEFLTSEGRHRDDGNHTTARWVDMFGEVDGQTAGIAMLSRPNNFRAPQAVRLHPTKPYFCFAPMVQGGFEITPEKPYQARYRYLVHDGPPKPKLIDQQWTEFSKSP